MQVDYAPFVDRMIQRYEGNYGWDKADPGGPTKYGITCYDLAEHRGQAMNSMSAWAPLVKAMPLSEAEEIYAKKYARALRFDDLPPGVDCCMMDYGVNSGVVRPIRVARALLSLPGKDVVDLPLSDAINAANAERFVNQMCDERLAYMHRIRGGAAWRTFGKGWQSRVDDLRTYSDRLARGWSPVTAPPAPDLSKVPTPKATNVAKPKTTVTAGGAVSAGTAAHLGGAPIWAVAGVIGAVVVAGVVYEIWSQHKADAANALVILPGAAHVG